MFDKILQKFGLEWSELNEAEKDQLRQMREAVRSESVEIDDMREHIDHMINQLVADLTEVGEDNWIPFFVSRRRREIRARLENYRLLKAVLHRPENMEKRAKAHVEQMLKKNEESGGWLS